MSEDSMHVIHLGSIPPLKALAPGERASSIKSAIHGSWLDGPFGEVTIEEFRIFEKVIESFGTVHVPSGNIAVEGGSTRKDIGKVSNLMV